MQRHIQFITWEHIDRAVGAIICALGDVSDRSGVFGVSRGGLVPAVMLSHRLGLPFLAHPDARMVWVDDIVDTGKTLSDWRRSYPGATFCSLIGNADRLISGSPLNDRAWYVFPWEDSSRAAGDYREYCERRGVE